MNRRYQPCRPRWCLVAGLCLIAGVAPAQEAKNRPGAAAMEAEALVERLTQIDQEDTGYSGSVSGSAFLPLGQSETYTMLLGQKPRSSSDTLRSLVKLGARAVPTLLEHLKDDRPTKITLQGGFGGMFISRDEDDKAKEREASGLGVEARYTVTVGDLCYVAVGQIVNRPYWAVRYQPTAIIFVTAVAKSKKLRAELVREWGKLTPDKHRDSLVRDLLDSGHERTRDGASLRLAYYYPDALEAAALKQLARPTYPVIPVNDLIRDKLYPAKSAKERKRLVDEFVAKHGEIARDGIRWELFDGLDTQQTDRARECLVDVFGLPPTVKSKDRPRVEPLDSAAQARFIQTLHYDQSTKLDRALRDVLARTDDDYTATGCLDRLVGRGYDADIEAYLKRRRPRWGDRERKEFLKYESKLGWTRLHAAVDLGVRELVERALREKIPVNARGRDGRTPLHLAAAEGRADVVDVLLAAEADPNIKDGTGRLAVQLAAQEDYPEIVRRLVAKGSAVSGVLAAAEVRAADRLAVLLREKPESVKLRNRDGFTPLHVAAREGHVGAARVLIDGGADVRAVDEPAGKYRSSSGWTALHLTVMAGKPATAELLLDRGADVNAADRDKLTPLHFAAWAGHAELVRLLIARRAVREVKDSQGRTPLDLAKVKGRSAVMKLLKR